MIRDPATTVTLSPPDRAVRYWRAACALAATHLLGTEWPPPGRIQRSRVVGHWGCNPGLAWATGHLAARHVADDPLLLVVGTGHAASFGFAHAAASGAVGAAAISEAAARYGQPGGEPSEPVGAPGVPYLGGELGAALAVSQGLASGHVAPVVCCVVGDGECETPAALAAFAHADVLLSGDRAAPWLPVLNANGARMGGPARWSGDGLTRLLSGLGYQVLRSGTNADEASAAAGEALAAVLAGHRAVWISETPKGWPAPELADGERYRGHRAHKAPSGIRGHGARPTDVTDWFTAIDTAGLLTDDGSVTADIARLAARVTLTVRTAAAPAVPRQSISADQVGDWRSSAASVDSALAPFGVLVTSPDEAASNGLHECGVAGRLVEVLAEETCAAWAWGRVEAGHPAVFATYEAFAPLAASMIAQYIKLTHARPTRGVPPLLVVATSLGWANSPTHQNTDLAGVLLARELPHVTVTYPVGARSAAYRATAQLARRRDGVALVAFSKQSLPDLPDPGSPLVRYRVMGAPPPAGYLITAGDVCAAEAVAAAAIAAEAGLGVEVIAVVEITAAAGELTRAVNRAGTSPLAGCTATAPAYVAPLWWQAANRVFPIAGYAERFGPTAWETLRANGLDRYSLLGVLREQGLRYPVESLARLAHRADEHMAARPSAGVLPFTCPPLVVDPTEDE